MTYNDIMVENESPRYRRGVCWFCQNPCNAFGYTHKECIVDYFAKQKQHQLVKA